VTNLPGFARDHNLYFLAHTDRGLGFDLEIGELLGDPLFVNLAGQDYHLRPSSPAIAEGQRLGYPLDFDNHPVPATTAPAVGAYEVQLP
jgi:hypothetical protein